ncbi:hypothetical protein U1Q18_040553 [Sarracenia purpurea var. burkii]
MSFETESSFVPHSFSRVIASSSSCNNRGGLEGNLKPVLVEIASKCVYPEGDIVKLGAPSVEGSVLGTVVKPKSELTIDESEESRAEGICKSELEKPKVEDGENRKVAATEVGVEVGRIDSDGGKDKVKVEATTDASNSGEGSKSKSEVMDLDPQASKIDDSRVGTENPWGNVVWGVVFFFVFLKFCVEAPSSKRHNTIYVLRIFPRFQFQLLRVPILTKWRRRFRLLK